VSEQQWVDPTLRGRIDGVCRALAEEFAGTFSPETVSEYVEGTLGRFEEHRVTTYIPIFVHRFARERLRALGQAEGAFAKDVPEVLFVCVHNAGRSQMAAALLNRAAHGRVHIRSAGSAPLEEIDRSVLDAMAEVGIDLSDELPKPWTDEVVRAADVLVTMGCGDACPVYPGKRYLDWELDDPAGKPLEQVRVIRDEIDHRVRALLEELAASASSSS
jgi:protein-tyrosine-phosphatase